MVCVGGFTRGFKEGNRDFVESNEENDVARQNNAA